MTYGKHNEQLTTAGHLVYDGYYDSSLTLEAVSCYLQANSAHGPAQVETWVELHPWAKGPPHGSVEHQILSDSRVVMALRFNHERTPNIITGNKSDK